MDIFKHLSNEHQTVQDLMGKIVACDDREEKRRLFLDMRDELLTHAKAEERAFYDILEDDDELEDLIDKARKDHQDIEQYLLQLAHMAVTDAAWHLLLQKLRERVETHVREEEGEIFSLAREIIDADESDDIARAMRQEEEAFRASF